METAFTIFIILMFTGVIGMITYFSVSLKWISLTIYFLQFKLEKHPILIAMLDDVLQRLSTEENVPVFHKSYEELNEDYPEDRDKAVGMYVHSANLEHQKKCDDALQEVRNLEKKWNRPYKDICEFLGTECNMKEDTLIVPKILMCKEETMKYGGLLSYYSTYFHEFGHHFAIKANGDRSELAADTQGHRLVSENLPDFFRLFPYINFEHRLKLPELTLKERFTLYYHYWQYLRIKNKK